jgi:tetratricopeptide (TPR) repeat protein
MKERAQVWVVAATLIIAAGPAFVQTCWLDPQPVEESVALAAEREWSGDPERALAILREAVSQQPQEAALHLELGRLLVRMGAGLKDPGRRLLFEQAVEAYQRVAMLRPNDAMALNELGLACRAVGQISQAIVAFHEAAAARPSWGGPEVNLADTYRLQERYDEARAVLLALEAHAVEISPHRVKNALAQVYLDMQQLRRAEVVLREAIALAPDYFPTRVSLGYALLEQRRYAEASQELEAAVHLDPRPETLFFLCQLYALQRRAGEVLSCLPRALKAGIPAEAIRKEEMFRFIRSRLEYQRLVGEER